MEVLAIRRRQRRAGQQDFHWSTLLTYVLRIRRSSFCEESAGPCAHSRLSPPIQKRHNTDIKSREIRLKKRQLLIIIKVSFLVAHVDMSAIRKQCFSCGE